MSPFFRALATPLARRFHAWAGARLAPLTRTARYHGVWAPGVALLRNTSLRRKTQLLALMFSVALALAGAHLVRDRWQDWQRANQVVAGAHQMQALSALQGKALDLVRAAYRAEADNNLALLPPALNQEAGAHDAYLLYIADALEALPELRRAHVALQARRREMLALRDDATPQTADGPGPRLAAARRYAEALEAVREQLLLPWSSLLNSDPESHVLLDGLVRMSIDARARLQRLLGAGNAMYQSEPPANARRVILERLVETRTVLSLARPSFDQARVLVPTHAALLDDARLDIERALAQVNRLSLLPAGAEPGSVLAQSELRAQGVRAMAAAQLLDTQGLALVEQRLQRQRAALQSRLIVEFTEGALALALIAYLLVCTYKVLAGGLAFLCGQVDELGRGNLAIRPSGHGSDEIGRALTVLGQAAAQMSALFEAVTNGVSAVSHASRTVATGNAGLTDRTNDIRASISSAADSTQTFAGAMDRCSDAVDRAAENLRAMRIEGQRCRKAMDGVHERMRTLKTKSREIEQVVGMIEAVAYQTRLLAINASVAAARAGPAGRGFAVVAQEVRALATRSQDATHRIQAIVDTSIEEIESGNEMSERLGQALVRADREVESVSGVIGEIVGLVRTSQTQALSVLDIARNVDETVGHNARLVKQLSDASAQLRDEGDSLKRSVQHFQFG